MTLRKITIDNSGRYVKKIAIYKVNKLKIVKQTGEKRIQFLKNKAKFFQKLKKNSLKILYQKRDSEYLNQ